MKQEGAKNLRENLVKSLRKLMDILKIVLKNDYSDYAFYISKEKDIFKNTETPLKDILVRMETIPNYISFVERFISSKLDDTDYITYLESIIKHISFKEYGITTFNNNSKFTNIEDLYKLEDLGITGLRTEPYKIKSRIISEVEKIKSDLKKILQKIKDYVNASIIFEKKVGRDVSSMIGEYSVRK